MYNPTYAQLYTLTLDARDCSILTFPIAEPPHGLRLAVLWDSDRDIRILNLILALRFRAPHLLLNLRAIMEHQGIVYSWIPHEVDPKQMLHALHGAAESALEPFDRWKVAMPYTVSCTGTNLILNRSALPEDSPLQLLPKGFSFGRVKP